MKSRTLAAGPLPHLDTFAKAAELSSFTAASKALGLTQASVSQRIGALEQILAVPLFRRRGGRVLLTEAGQRLYEFAQRILELHREARSEIAGHEAPLVGTLALAASSIPGEHLLPALLERLRERYPHVRVRATVTDTEQVLHQVEQGHVHLGLVGGKGDSPHLAYRAFARDRLVLAVSAKHPWAGRRRVSVAQVLSQGLILREPGSASRSCFEQALATAGHAPRDLQVILELGSNEAIKAAVRRGLGAAILSSHAVDKETQAGQLHALTITGLALTRSLWVVWDERRVLPIPARLFLELLGESP